MTSKKEFVNRSVCYLNKIFYAGALNTERPRFLSDPPAPRMHLPESRILDSFRLDIDYLLFVKSPDCLFECFFAAAK